MIADQPAPTNEERVLTLLRTLATQRLGVDLDAEVAARSYEFWALGVDSKKRRFRDLIGNIDGSSMAIINSKFQDADAGFKAKADKVLGLHRRADIFLLNEDHLYKNDDALTPLLVHELCHFVEQIGKVKGKFTQADRHNGVEILASYHDQVRALHTVTWSRLMARAARRAVECFSASSVAEFLEQAIPDYDRPGWNRKKLMEPGQAESGDQV